MAKQVICEHCGATCNIDDGFCKSCWKKLSNDDVTEDYIIEGLGKSEWTDFIDKNADRYTAIYEKNEGKKIFANMNWSAFFFGFNWMFYRKMYKFAVIGYVAYFIATLILTICLTLPYQAEIRALQEDIEPYKDYSNTGGIISYYDQDGNYHTPDFVQKGILAEKRLFEIKTGIMFKCLILVPIQGLIIGLFGDCIYRAHIMKNISSKKGGASIASVFCGSILINIIEAFALSPISSLIMSLLS